MLYALRCVLRVVRCLLVRQEPLDTFVSILILYESVEIHFSMLSHWYMHICTPAVYSKVTTAKETYWLETYIRHRFESTKFVK